MNQGQRYIKVFALNGEGHKYIELLSRADVLGKEAADRRDEERRLRSEAQQLLPVIINQTLQENGLATCHAATVSDNGKYLIAYGSEPLVPDTCTPTPTT